MFENYKVFRYTNTPADRLRVETGKVAGLANGSAIAAATATPSVLWRAPPQPQKPRDGHRLSPAKSVDFDERMYAAGIESPAATCAARRQALRKGGADLPRDPTVPIRPLFPKDLRNDVGADADRDERLITDCSPEITAMIGASIALSISDIPWNGPIGGVFVGTGRRQNSSSTRPPSEQSGQRPPADRRGDR